MGAFDDLMPSRGNALSFQGGQPLRAPRGNALRPEQSGAFDDLIEEAQRADERIQSDGFEDLLPDQAGAKRSTEGAFDDLGTNQDERRMDFGAGLRDANDPASKRAERIEPGMLETAGTYAKEFGKGVVRGAANLAGTGLKFVGVAQMAGARSMRQYVQRQLEVQDRIDRGESVDAKEDHYGYAAMPPAERQATKQRLRGRLTQFDLPGGPTDRDFYKAGRFVQEAGERAAPTAEGWKDSTTGALGEGVGSVVAGVPVALGGVGPAALVFGAAGGGEALDRAVQDKASPDDQLKAAVLGVAPGLTDVAPIELLLHSNRLTAPFAKPLANAIARIGGQAFIEGIQEGGQQFLQNLIARNVYKPDQSLTEDVVPNTTMGGGVGAISATFVELARMFGGRRGGHVKQPPPVPRQQQEGIPASVPPPDFVGEAGRNALAQSPASQRAEDLAGAAAGYDDAVRRYGFDSPEARAARANVDLSQWPASSGSQAGAFDDLANVSQPPRNALAGAYDNAPFRQPTPFDDGLGPESTPRNALQNDTAPTGKEPSLPDFALTRKGDALAYGGSGEVARRRQQRADRSELELSAGRLMDDVRAYEDEMRASGASPEQIAAGLEQTFGFEVTPEQIARGSGWWRVEEIIGRETGKTSTGKVAKLSLPPEAEDRIRSEWRDLSTPELARRLHEAYGISASSSTINRRRLELGVPSSMKGNRLPAEIQEALRSYPASEMTGAEAASYLARRFRRQLTGQAVNQWRRNDALRRAVTTQGVVDLLRTPEMVSLSNARAAEVLNDRLRQQGVQVDARRVGRIRAANGISNGNQARSGAIPRDRLHTMLRDPAIAEMTNEKAAAAITAAGLSVSPRTVWTARREIGEPNRPSSRFTAREGRDDILGFLRTPEAGDLSHGQVADRFGVDREYVRNLRRVHGLERRHSERFVRSATANWSGGPTQFLLSEEGQQLGHRQMAEELTRRYPGNQFTVDSVRARRREYGLTQDRGAPNPAQLLAQPAFNASAFREANALLQMLVGSKSAGISDERFARLISERLGRHLTTAEVKELRERAREAHQQLTGRKPHFALGANIEGAFDDLIEDQNDIEAAKAAGFWPKGADRSPARELLQFRHARIVADIVREIEGRRLPDLAMSGEIGASNRARAGRPEAREAIDLAKRMERDGHSRDEIWQATADYLRERDPALIGVFKGVDGKWRVEVSDASATFTGRASKGGENLDKFMPDMFQHDDLYLTYPDLKGVRAGWEAGAKAYARAQAKGLPTGMYISSRASPDGTEMIAAGAPSRSELPPPIMHETQHAIQQREGFARGASTRMGVDHYARQAGEVEARNVETRLSMTDEDRRATPPWETEDVPAGQQIVSFFGERAENSKASREWTGTRRGVARPISWDSPSVKALLENGRTQAQGRRLVDWDSPAVRAFLSRRAYRGDDGHNGMWPQKAIDLLRQTEGHLSYSEQASRLAPMMDAPITASTVRSLFRQLHQLSPSVARAAPTQFDWPPEALQMIRQAEGRSSFSELARALSDRFDVRVTRDMVAGKVRRLREISGSNGPLLAASDDPEGWFARFKRGSNAQAGESSQVRDGLDQASREVPEGSSRTDSAVGSGSGRDDAGRARGRVERFDLGRYTGRVVETPNVHGLRQRRYFLFSASSETPGLTHSPGTAVRVLNAMRTWIAKAHVSEIAPGRWQVLKVNVRGNMQRRGVGTDLYDAMNRDLGTDLGPSPTLTRKLFQFWRHRDPSAVANYQPIGNLFHSPETLRALKRANDQLLRNPPTARDAAYAKRFAVVVDEALADAENIPDWARSDNAARTHAFESVRRGETLTIPQPVVARMLEGVENARTRIPAGAEVGALESITPLNARGSYPGADVVARFRSTDGGFFDVELPLTTLTTSRALYDNITGRIGLSRFGLFGGLDQSIAGEIDHEAIHYLRRKGVLVGAVWDRLVSHARNLRVLEGGLATYLRMVGDPSAGKADPHETIQEAYQRIYRGARDFNERMDQEAVAHMRELYAHGQLLPQEIAPVKDILDGLNGSQDETAGGFDDLAEAAGSGGAFDDLMGEADGNEDYRDQAASAPRNRNIDALGYYSKLDEVLGDLRPTDFVTAETLQKRGVKQAEMEARGLSDLLRDGSAAKASDLQRVAAENPVAVNETRYGRTPESDQAANQALERVAALSREFQAEAARDPNSPRLEELFRRKQAAEVEYGALTASGRGKWAAYSLDPSNPTYRETVLHLPANEAGLDKISKKLFGKPFSELRAQERDLVQAEIGHPKYGDGNTFQSGHWSEPNVIAHARTSMLKDAQGRDVFHVDELQSDWGQKVRGGGVRDEAKLADLQRRARQLEDKASTERARAEAFVRSNGGTDAGFRSNIDYVGQFLRQKMNDDPRAREVYDELHSAARTRDLAQAELRTAEAAAPGHPLVKTTDQWVNTALRRMIRQAVEQGADYIAIPSGRTVLNYGMGGDAKGIRYAYDQMYPKNLRNILRTLDPRIEGRNASDLRNPETGKVSPQLDSATVFPLSDAVKAQVWNEGQPLFATTSKELGAFEGLEDEWQEAHWKALSERSAVFEKNEWERTAPAARLRQKPPPAYAEMEADRLTEAVRDFEDALIGEGLPPPAIAAEISKHFGFPVDAKAYESGLVWWRMEQIGKDELARLGEMQDARKKLTAPERGAKGEGSIKAPETALAAAFAEAAAKAEADAVGKAVEKRTPKSVGFDISAEQRVEALQMSKQGRSVVDITNHLANATGRYVSIGAVSQIVSEDRIARSVGRPRSYLREHVGLPRYAGLTAKDIAADLTQRLGHKISPQAVAHQRNQLRAAGVDIRSAAKGQSVWKGKLLVALKRDDIRRLSASEAARQLNDEFGLGLTMQSVKSARSEYGIPSEFEAAAAVPHVYPSKSDGYYLISDYGSGTRFSTGIKITEPVERAERVLADYLDAKGKGELFVPQRAKKGRSQKPARLIEKKRSGSGSAYFEIREGNTGITLPQTVSKSDAEALLALYNEQGAEAVRDALSKRDAPNANLKPPRLFLRKRGGREFYTILDNGREFGTGAGSDRSKAEEALAAYIARKESAADAPAGAGPMLALSAGHPTITTPGGEMEVATQPEIVDIADLKQATDDLQPRDRGRAESSIGVRQRATSLDASRLMPERVSDSGAPIVDQDNTIISGNGRVLSIEEAYRDTTLADRASQYRQAVIDYAQRTGLGNAASTMRYPVLVSRITDTLSRADLARFADLSNRSAIAEMASPERAMRDARALGPQILGLYRGGEFTAPDNRAFYRAFMDTAVSASERGSISHDGELTKDGEDRMSAAVLAGAYGDPALLSRMLESTDDNIRSVTGAMRDAAGGFVLLKQAIDAGEVDQAFDITPQLAETARRIADLRSRRVSLQAFMAQQDAFNKLDPIVEDLLRGFHNDSLTRALAREKLTELLASYADEAVKHKQNGLMPDETTPAAIVQYAAKRAARSFDDFLPGGSGAARRADDRARQANQGRGADSDGGGQSGKAASQGLTPLSRNALAGGSQHRANALLTGLRQAPTTGGNALMGALPAPPSSTPPALPPPPPSGGVPPLTPGQPPNPATVRALNSWKTRLVETFQNSQERMRILVDRVGQGRLADSEDPYLRASLYHGRLDARVRYGTEIAEQIVFGINAQARVSGISHEDMRELVNDYLIARHAPERNAIHGDGAAGMTNAEAQQTLSDINARPDAAAIRSIADRVRSLHEMSLDALRGAGVISDQLYNRLRNAYRHHVPLNRLVPGQADVAGGIAGKGFDVYSTGIKRAKGSDLEVLDVLGNVLSNFEQAMVRSEKNLVDLSSLEFLRRNHADLAGFMEERRPPVIGTASNGQPIYQQSNDPRILHLFEDGRPVWIRFSDPRLAAAFKASNSESLPASLRWVSVMTRVYSSLATRFNPEFALPNKIRDLQETIAYMGAQRQIGARGAAKVLARDPASTKAVLDYLAGRSTVGARLYQEMINAGGTTGGMGLSTREGVQLKIDDLDRLAQSSPRRFARRVVELVDNWNTIFEDSTRLSVYRAARDHGLSRDRAAFLAKEASINFNRMGTAGPVINGLYMFANASIQGSAKMIRSMRNPKVAAAVGITIAAAVAGVSEWNDDIDPNWRDKVSKWDRLNGLPIVLPNEKGDGVRYVTIPVSWGMKPIMVAAAAAYDAAKGLAVDWATALSDVTTAMIEAYNPLGGTDLVQALTPTIGDTPIDIARNSKWSGGPIRPDQDRNLPYDKQYFLNLKDTKSGRAAIKATEALHDYTGIELSPADLAYAVEQYIGGTGRSVRKTFDTIIGVGSGSPPPADEFPMLSRFYRERSEEEIGRGAGGKSEEIAERLRQQSRQRFDQRSHIDDILRSMEGMSAEERRERLRDLRGNRSVYERVRDGLRMEERGLTWQDKQILRLGIDNGERARFLAEELRPLSSAGRATRMKELRRKQIITPEVMHQIRAILAGRQPRSNAPLPLGEPTWPLPPQRPPNALLNAPVTSPPNHRRNALMP